MTRDQNRLARDRKSLADHLKRLAIQTSEVKMAADVLERLKSLVISVRAGIARSASRTRRARLRSGAREQVLSSRILASFGDQRARIGARARPLERLRAALERDLSELASATGVNVDALVRRAVDGTPWVKIDSSSGPDEEEDAMGIPVGAALLADLRRLASA